MVKLKNNWQKNTNFFPWFKWQQYRQRGRNVRHFMQMNVERTRINDKVKNSGIL